MAKALGSVFGCSLDTAVQLQEELEADYPIWSSMGRGTEPGGRNGWIRTSAADGTRSVPATGVNRGISSDSNVSSASKWPSKLLNEPSGLFLVLIDNYDLPGDKRSHAFRPPTHFE